MTTMASRDSSSDHDPRPEASIGAKGRIAGGLAANAAGNVVTLLIQVLSVPLLLAAWGLPTYGEWLILSAIPLYLALSDLGLASVAGNEMTMLAATNRRSDAAALGSEVWSLVTTTTVVVVVVAIAITPAVMGLVRVPGPMATSEVRLVLVALFLQIAVGGQFALLDASYRAGGQYALGVWMRQLGRLFEFGALLAVVALGGRPLAAAVAFLVGSIAGVAVSYRVLHKRIPWVLRRPSRPRMQTARRMLAPGLAFLAFPLGNALSVQGLTIVVGALLGAAAVVVFSTTRTLTRLVTQLLTSVNLAVWPELSRSVAGGNFEQARLIQRRAVQFSIVVATLACVVLIVAGQSIVRTWTRGAVDPPLSLLAVLVLVVLANSFWFTLTAVLVATNRHTGIAVAYLIGTAAAVLLAIPASLVYGVVGAAAVLFAIDLMMSAFVLPAALAAVRDTRTAFVAALLDVSGLARSLARARTPRPG
jgi:O-antigen/teichoic acid export membrane protein